MRNFSPALSSASTVYVNDICFNFKSDIKLFADDTSLLSIADNPATAARELNADLHTLQVWAGQWFLYFSSTKITFFIPE